MKINVVWLKAQEHLPGLSASSMLRAAPGLELDFDAGMLKVTKETEVVALVPVGNIRWMQPAPKTKA